MTVERWTDEMLDRFATETQINIVQEREARRELTQSVASLLEAVRLSTANIETVVARIDVMQSEIRGLQTENRRILDRFFPEQE